MMCTHQQTLFGSSLHEEWAEWATWHEGGVQSCIQGFGGEDLKEIDHLTLNLLAPTTVGARINP